MTQNQHAPMEHAVIDSELSLSQISDYQMNIRADQLLNAAIRNADIGAGYEEHLAIFDRYYADEIQASMDGFLPVSGKTAVRNQITAFLMPIHMFVEVGGARSSLRIEPIASDTRDETHSRWTFELMGTMGRGTVLKWRARRKWREGQVVYEHIGEIEQTGGPLTEHDFSPFPDLPTVN